MTGRPVPKHPRDLANHQCVNLRLTTSGGLYAWELHKGTQVVHVRVDGQLIFNRSQPMLAAALAGFGIAHVPEPICAQHLAAGRLVPVMEEWWPTFPGQHLYYPSRRQSSPAFALLVDALRHRG